MKKVKIQVVESKELEIPTKVGELENDKGYIRKRDLPEEQDLSNYATKHYVDDAIESIEIPSVNTPTNTYKNISEIKAIPNPKQGQTVVNSFNGGVWVFDKTPFCQLDADINLALHGRAKNVKTTPIEKTLVIDSMCGQTFRTNSGAYVQFRKDNGRLVGEALSDMYEVLNRNNGSHYNQIYKGATIANCWLYNIKEEDAFSGDDCEQHKSDIALKKGESLYYLGDDVIFATPTNYDGHGVWKRTNVGSRLTPEDAECVSASSSFDKNPYNNHEKLQKLFDNWFYNVYITKGIWNTTKSIKLRRTKSIKSDGIFITRNGLTNTGGIGASRSDLSTCGVISTQNNIELIQKQGGTLYDSNLNLDGSAIPNADKDLFVVDMNYSTNYMRTTHLTMLGNAETLYLTENGGSSGLNLDASNLEPKYGNKGFKDLYKGTNGTMFFSEKNSVCLYNLNHGIRATTGKGKANNINGIEIEILDSLNVKWRLHNLRSMGNSRFFDRTVQAHKNVRKNQRHIPHIILQGQCYFDGFPMDWRSGQADEKYYYNDVPSNLIKFQKYVPSDWRSKIDDEKGTYTYADKDGNIHKYIELYIPDTYIEFRGRQIEVGQMTAEEMRRRGDLFKNASMVQGLDYPGITNSEIHITKRNRGFTQGAFIEDLHNSLLYADLDEDCQNYYVKGFKADATKQSAISVTNPTTILRHGGADTKVTFGVGANKDTDYVEFYIDGNRGRLRNSRGLFITLSGDNLPKYITTNLTDKPVNIEGMYGSNTISIKLKEDTPDKYVIRFYGIGNPFHSSDDDSVIVENKSESGSYKIQSIAIDNSYHDELPFVTKGLYFQLLDRIEKLEK
jgi:hypothetical protein